MEAVTVRQFLLVTVLIAAAFAGGAFVNGPALQWAQNRLFRSFGWHEGDIASIDLKAGANGDSGPDVLTVSKADVKALAVPLAPVPSLVAEGNLSGVEPVTEQNVPTSRRPKDQVKSKLFREHSPGIATLPSQAQSQNLVSPEGPASLDINLKPVSSVSAVPVVCAACKIQPRPGDP